MLTRKGKRRATDTLSPLWRIASLEGPLLRELRLRRIFTDYARA